VFCNAVMKTQHFAGRQRLGLMSGQTRGGAVKVGAQATFSSDILYDTATETTLRCVADHPRAGFARPRRFRTHLRDAPSALQGGSINCACGRTRPYSPMFHRDRSRSIKGSSPGTGFAGRSSLSIAARRKASPDFRLCACLSIGWPKHEQHRLHLLRAFSFQALGSARLWLADAGNARVIRSESGQIRPDRAGRWWAPAICRPTEDA